MKRDVLHRDMSKFNILIYPRWSTHTKTQPMQTPPPFIHDLLSEKLRYATCSHYSLYLFSHYCSPPEERKAACLVIDLDNGARLDTNVSQTDEELRH